MKTYTNPAFPGKTFRRLEVGEIKQVGDYIAHYGEEWRLTMSAGFKTPESHEVYREIPTPTLDPSALMLQRIEQKLDSALAKLND